MPRRKFMQLGLFNDSDKKNATHFTVVHRPQNDPLIYDESAPQLVLNPTQPRNDSKVKRLGDLASELGSDAFSIRDNEGEAANYGIYFDDTEYDYMQHLREIGSGTGEAIFVEATPARNNQKGKGKQKASLEDALRQLDLEHRSHDLLDEELLPSKNLRSVTYESQQDVPDAIAGFQPDMDPRLREVLEALEDDAFVDDDEEIFKELAKDGRELDEREFEQDAHDLDAEDQDDGWESDDTAKPTKEFRDDDHDEVPSLVQGDGSAQPDEGPSQDWLEDFKKFKRDQKADKKTPARAAAPSEMQSSLWTTTTSGGRKKKRKGALTNLSAYSMTSSSLVRNEQMSILDSRFEKIEEEYNADLDDMGSVSAVSAVSSVQGPTRDDFDGLLDDFLGNYTMHGKKNVRKGGWNSGTEQLDEIRRELGAPRIPSKYRSK